MTGAERSDKQRASGVSGGASPGVPATGLFADPRLWAPRLSRILDRQFELYTQLGELAAEQSVCVETDDSDELLRVLARRQTIVDQVCALNDEIHPFVHRWEELSPRLTVPQREALRKQFDEVGVLVESIRERDEADRRALEARRETIGKEMEGLVRARGAAAAYASRQPSAPIYQDRNG